MPTASPAPPATPSQRIHSTNGNGSFLMGVPAVMVDEKGNRIPGEVPFDEILRHPERHSKAVMHDFLHKPEFCAACHKANLPAHAERLQIHPRVYRLRRVAEVQVFAAQSADFLHRRLHHLPGMPHEARRRSPCPTTAPRTARWLRIAGSPAIRPCLSTTASTSS